MPIPPKPPVPDAGLDSLLGGQPEPVSYRDFGDADSMRQRIFDNTLAGLKKKYPLENTRYRLELQNLRYLDTKPYSLKDQKQAIMRGQSLDYRLGGDWVLTDKATNKEVDRKPGIVAHVPYATNRGTFIHGGSEYTVANQMRLKPGVYARVRENGIIEAHVNAKPGTGQAFKVYMEPETGVFRLGVGQSTLKLYPLLKAMGVQDRDLEQTWGAELLRKNIEAEDPRAVSRAFAKLVNTRADQSDAQQPQQSAEAFPAENTLWKEAQIGARESDRKWQQLWFPGRLRRSVHKDKDWVLLDVHRGLCEAAFDALRSEGIECDAHYTNPHISVLRPEECAELKKKFGHSWTGAVKAGTQFRFKLMRMVSLIPASWKDMERVWFLECESPDLLKYRKELGFSTLPKNPESGHDMRFHITVAVRRKHEVKAAELLCGNVRVQREEALLDFTEKAAAVDTEYGPKLRETFEKVELDPDVTQATLGQKHLNAGLPMLMRTTQKILNIQRGQEETDDRDSLAYQTFHAPEDFFRERVEKDAGHIGRKMLWKATLRGNLKHVPSGVLTPQLRGVLMRSGLGMPLEEVNPLDIFDQQTRILRLGEGGMAGTQSIPDESRSVQPSHFGYIDPIRAPECYDAQTEVLTEQGWKLWPQVTQQDKLACLVCGQREFRTPERLVSAPYRGTMHGAKTALLEYLVTPNHRMWVRPFYAFKPVTELQGDEWLLCGDGVEEASEHKVTAAQRYEREYDGMVYCATVPGGMLYVRRNGSAGFWCGNSEKIGVDARVAHRAMKGSDGKLYSYLRDVKTGKEVPVSADKAAQAVVAFPGELEKPGDKIRAMVRSRSVEYVDRKDVDYALPSPTQMFTATSNLVPLLSANKGGRILMGAKFLAQALPLREAEAPLVQSVDETGTPFVDRYARHAGAVFAKDGGMVTDVGKDYVTVRHKDGNRETYELYDNFPYNRRTFVHNTPAVKIGDKVNPGQLLARSNYTDDKGRMAVGKNLRVAYVAYRGKNYEDAVTISESAARKMSSEHMYQHELDLEDDNKELGRGPYISIFPTRFTRTQLDTLDKDGVVKPGTTVKHGDPLILALTKAKPTAVHKGHRPLYSDGTVTWDHDSDGVVTDISPTKGGGWNVTVKAYSPAIVGDKLVGLSGDKGVIGDIIPDDQVPHDKDGNPVDIMLNPLGVISRGNPGQVYEALLGKIARKRGEPYKVSGFNDENLLDFVKRELQRHGMSDTEDLVDPSTGRKIPKVLTGERFILKLHHMAEHKGKGRDVGAYTSEGIPARGGDLGCFPASQKVQTEQGEVEIGRIVAERQPVSVLTYDTEAQKWVFRPVTDWFTYQARAGELLTLTILSASGQKHTVSPTQSHQMVKADGSYIGAGELQVGDRLRACSVAGSAGCTTVEVVDIQPYVPDERGAERVNVYDITVADTHTYVVGATLVSNSKRVSGMEIGALLAHGVPSVLRDAQTVRGQRNDDYWKAFRMGVTPPSPKVPMIYKKFLAMLEGSGVHVQKNGSKLQLFALRDKDVDELSTGEITSADTVRGDDLKPIAGGLFDEKLTGGHGGDRWAHITLAEPLPNPMMEEPIRRLLGLTQKKFDAVLAGQEQLGGETGGAAIASALKRINVDSAIDHYRTAVTEGPKSKRDVAAKNLSYLKSLKREGMHPSDWIMSKVPVLPPNFRPITAFKKMQLIADPNYLYRDLLSANDDLKSMRGQVGEGQLGNERLQLYNSFKALTGLGDPVQAKTQEKGVRGLLQHIFGAGSPKTGLFQRRVLGMPVDMVGRAVITPNADLNMDQVGLPEEKAWTIYRPFVVRRLIRRGLPAVEAAKAVSNQTDVARSAMLDEMKARPVMINRAPTLHRYGFMAAWPVLTKGHTLQISPVLTAGFGADFDGDQMNYHVPVDDDAVQEAVERMLPSKNLRAARDFKVHYMPRNEFLLGLYLSSSAKNKHKQPRVFRSKADVIAAYRRGEIDVSDPVTIAGE